MQIATLLVVASCNYAYILPWHHDSTCWYINLSFVLSINWIAHFYSENGQYLLDAGVIWAALDSTRKLISNLGLSNYLQNYIFNLVRCIILMHCTNCVQCRVGDPYSITCPSCKKERIMEALKLGLRRRLYVATCNDSQYHWTFCARLRT